MRGLRIVFDREFRQVAEAVKFLFPKFVNLFSRQFLLNFCTESWLLYFCRCYRLFAFLCLLRSLYTKVKGSAKKDWKTALSSNFVVIMNFFHFILISQPRRISMITSRISSAVHLLYTLDTRPSLEPLRKYTFLLNFFFNLLDLVLYIYQKLAYLHSLKHTIFIIKSLHWSLATVLIAVATCYLYKNKALGPETSLVVKAESGKIEPEKAKNPAKDAKFSLENAVRCVSKANINSLTCMANVLISKIVENFIQTMLKNPNSLHPKAKKYAFTCVSSSSGEVQHGDSSTGYSQKMLQRLETEILNSRVVRKLHVKIIKAQKKQENKPIFAFLQVIQPRLSQTVRKAESRAVGRLKPKLSRAISRIERKFVKANLNLKLESIYAELINLSSIIDRFITVKPKANVQKGKIDEQTKELKSVKTRLKSIHSELCVVNYELENIRSSAELEVIFVSILKANLLWSLDHITKTIEHLNHTIKLYIY